MQIPTVSVRKISLLLRMALSLSLSVCVGGLPARAEPAGQSIVFYYGDTPVSSQLSRFDLAVLEPDSGFLPRENRGSATRWFAYVSVGEVGRGRSYYSAIPKDWIIGRNAEWQSDIVDQTVQGWPAFFVDHVITPLWEKGYQGFFLDTLDSYLLVSPGELDQRASQSGLIAVIRAIRDRYPNAVLILNRGFELLPAVHEHVYAVAFESLFKGWSEARGQYVDVPEDDRQWLLGKVREVQRRYKLPVIAIDYCLPVADHCSKDIVERIRALGMIPYVGDGRLQEVNFTTLD